MIVGTAGHIDHGKTTLVRALTGIDADRLPEEKARGITIDLGFAYRPLGTADTLGFVDVPGHERFIHNMLAGATGIDLVMLVVAADDGVRRQTVEHVQILDLLGLTRGLAVITKADLADAARLAAVEAEIRQLLAPTGLAGLDLHAVSAATGQGIAALERRLLALAAGLPARPPAGDFRLQVDRCFTIAGAGTVVTGTVLAGRVAVGDDLVLCPGGRRARVRGLHVQNRPAQGGGVGQRCAVNLAGADVARDRIHRGDTLLAPRLDRATDRLDVRLRLLAAEPRAMRHWTPVHIHLGTSDLTGRVALLHDKALEPGAAALAQLVLDAPLSALRGDRFVLRDQTARRTVGGGLVLDPFPPARGRRRPERLAVLAALEAPTAEAALERLLALPPHFVALEPFALAWNLPAEDLSVLHEIVEFQDLGGHAVAPARAAEWTGMLTDALARHHQAAPDQPGLEHRRLRLALPVRLPEALFAALVAAAVAGGTIRLDGPWICLQGHKVALSPADQKLQARIEPLLVADRYDPPRVRDIAGRLNLREEEVRRLMRRLARMGRLVEVAPDHFYPRPVVAEMAGMVGTIAAATPGGQITAAQFRDRIGTGRKLAILILEFFDRMGVTLRHGDLRRPRPEKRDLFGAGPA